MRPAIPPAAPPPPDASESNASEDASVDGLLTPSNMVMLAMIAFGVVYIFYRFSLEDVWAIVKAGLGLSFIIFLHELGHFLAAKWCGVNVTTFSIGFGPAIPGCRFTWGETTYMLAIIPLGGYVQMVGQVDGDESSDGSEDDPRSYRRKTVGQRMLIISAGVIMNAILAVLCFITVYQGPGKENPVAVIGSIDSAAPAFQRGLRTSGKITYFEPYEDPTFTDLMQSVINSLHDQEIGITFERAGEAPIETKIHAIPLEDSPGRPTRPIIGVQSPPSLRLAIQREALYGPFYPGTTAANAGFKPGDRIVAMSDADEPTKVTPLPEDPRFAGMGKYDYFEFHKRMQHLAGKDVILRVKRGDSGSETADIKVEPMYRIDLGVRMHMGPVLVVRDNSPAAKEDVRAPNKETKRKGDLIEGVSVVDVDGKILEYTGATLDPERLPVQLRQWADRLEKAKSKEPRKVKLQLRRHKDIKENPGSETETVKVDLTWDGDWRYDRVFPLSPTAPMPIPELGLAYEIKAIVADVVNKESPLQKDDRIINIKFERVGHKEDVKADWSRAEIKEGQWANISFLYLQQALTYKKLTIKVKRDKEEKEFEVPIVLDKNIPLDEYGWAFSQDTRRVTASNPLEAIQLGIRDTHRSMMQVFLNIRGMFSGRISVFNLGGPLTIARGAFIFAGRDFGEFVFFLGLISINLAVVNFLPIPVLDGGHMVFLLYEKIRGQPASESVRMWATYIGLAMIASLMIFVLSIDVMREFFKP